MEYIDELERNLGYTLQPTYFEMSSVDTNSNSMQIGDVNNNNVNTESNTIQTSSSSSSPHRVESNSIKKRHRYSVEYKKKILHMLETRSQTEVQALVNIDRRVIGKWAKEINKNKIENCTGARGTYTIHAANQGWWPELETQLYQWFKYIRARGGCVSEKCFKTQALLLYPEIYKKSVDIPSFCASNGWFENFLQRYNLVLRRITAKGRDLPKNIRAISYDWFAKCNEIFKKALFNRRLLMNMDETSIYIDFSSSYTYEESNVSKL